MTWLKLWLKFPLILPFKLVYIEIDIHNILRANENYIFQGCLQLAGIAFLNFNQLWIYCRALTNGQRGEVYEVNGDEVAVILDVKEDRANEGEVENLNNDRVAPPVYWIHGTFFLFKILKDFNPLNS